MIPLTVGRPDGHGIAQTQAELFVADNLADVWARKYATASTDVTMPD
jgi:hypothetical protein